MKNKYIDLIEQTFEFPQDEFSVTDNELNFHEVPLMDVIKQYGTPLKITYLPKITSQIQRAKRLFNVAMAKVDYKGSYNYCYCTKSSHFSFVLEEALKNDINLETSSAYDIHIINALYDGGVIVSFILYVRLFTSPLTQIAQGMTNLQTASASAHRIFDFLESEELPDESEKTKSLSTVRGHVCFDHVRFSYPDTPDKIIIKDFSAEVQPGQKVAIVGPTGAGKTTMVNLLMRFFELNGGSISIDDVPICDMHREEVHRLFGMVLQDTWLFEGTVRENLVYNMQGITDEQLMRVCRACGLDKFVRSLPNGLDTVLSESTSISAGQKQLLTIARAMLQNAPMLILDEATSSVDTRTELLIQRAMDELTKGRTSFVIAHRLSTIKNADLILVMRDGDVIESGTHDELMQRGGFYSELYNSQFEQAS